MKFTKREILGIFLIFIIGFLAWGSWRAFFFAVTTSGVSDIWQVVAWFFLLVMFFFLGTVLWTNLFLRIAGGALVFLPGLLFISSWEYVIAGFFSVIFIFWSSVTIAREIEERVHFRFFKSARVGQFLFVLGLSFSIAAGYYVFLKNVSWEELVPRFRIGEEMSTVIFKVAGVINPGFAKLSEGTVTVDEFLLSFGQNKPEGESLPRKDSGKQITEQDILRVFPQPSQYSQGKNIVLLSDLDQEQIAQRLFLESGREQVATLVGHPVAGSEKMSDILSFAVQKRLIAFLRGGEVTRQAPSPAVPFFLSLLLFLTLLSLVSIFAPLCIFGAELIFLFLLRSGWLEISTFSVEQEKLVE